MIQTKQDAYAFLASNDSAVEGLLLLSPCVNIASKQEQSWTTIGSHSVANWRLSMNRMRHYQMGKTFFDSGWLRIMISAYLFDQFIKLLQQFIGRRWYGWIRRWRRWCLSRNRWLVFFKHQETFICTFQLDPFELRTGITSLICNSIVCRDHGLLRTKRFINDHTHKHTQVLAPIGVNNISRGDRTCIPRDLPTVLGVSQPSRRRRQQ